MARKTAKKARKTARKARGKTTAKRSKKKATRGARRSGTELIISKSRTKAAASLNVSSDFYSALDDAVRALIAGAEARASENGRRTLRPHDL